MSGDLTSPSSTADTDGEDDWGCEPCSVDGADAFIAAHTNLCCRQEAGSSGVNHRQISNLYQVSLDTTRCPFIFQYHVDVQVARDAEEPHSQRIGGRPLQSSLIRDVVDCTIQQNVAAFGNVPVVHDGGNALYTPSPLAWDPPDRTFENVTSRARNGYGIPVSPHEKRARQFTVRMRLVQAMDTQKLAQSFEDSTIDVAHLIQAIDAVTKAGVCGSMIEYGGNFYSSLNPVKLNNTRGKTLYRGHHQSLRYGGGTLLLNVDQVYTEFYSAGMLLDVVADAFGVQDYNDIQVTSEEDTRKLARCIRRLSVNVVHRQTSLKQVQGVSAYPAHSTTFDVGGRQMSVVDYFLSRYHVRLQYPNLPPVNLGGQQPGRQAWVPLELCEVAPGQPCKGSECSFSSTQRQLTSPRPRERRRVIDGIREQINLDNPVMDIYGVRVDRYMAAVAARVLDAPGIQYANEVVRPKLGTWSLADKHFVQPAVLSNWGAMLCSGPSDGRLSAQPRQLEGFTDKLKKAAGKLGITVMFPAVIPRLRTGKSVQSQMTTCLEHVAEETSNRGPPQLLLVVIPDNDASTYYEVKRIAHTVLGIPSQCVTAKVLRQANAQVLANLCLKINSKLGGVNSVLPRGTLPLVQEAPTIVIGTDMTYMRLENRNRPPISSVVASLDGNAAKYAARLAVQEGSNDISHMPRMLWELFREHLKYARRKPQHVIYFRGGVGSSRLEDACQAEMRALKKAFRMLDGEYQPQVTFIVVNKHHHVRLFVPDRAARDDHDRSGNPVPGTVVDTGTLVNPHLFEFFLMAHSGIQGTSVPTQYTVLVDQNDFGTDRLEKLCYCLCYSYARCSRSVSIVPPIYYAQLAAERALGCISEDFDNDSSSSSADQPSVGPKFKLAELRDQLSGVMYFV